MPISNWSKQRGRFVCSCGNHGGRSCDLFVLGFLYRNEQNEGRRGGAYYVYELDMEPAIVFDICDALHVSPD